jgi:hypothetical protein
MAIVKMAEASGQTLDYSLPFDSDSTRRWLCVTSHNFHTSADVYQYGLDNNILPLPYVSYHPVLVGHSCRNVKVTQDDGAPRKWTIEATYSSKPIKENQAEENPLNRPAQIEIETASYRRAIWQDIDGNAVLNSAGDYFDPPVEIDVGYWTFRVKKNVADIPTYLLDYENAVNNASFTIRGLSIGQYEAKLSNIRVGDLKIEGDYQYFEFSYTMERRREKWIPLKVLDQGLRFKSEANRKHIMDNSTPPRPVTSPRLLDGNGAVLSDPTPTNAKYREFTVYYARNFSVLPGVT